MATVIVVTDFSQSAQNALKYVCAFDAASSKMELLLINIDTVPASYSGDGFQWPPSLIHLALQLIN